MTTPQRILILTGIALIVCTMAFGVGYALFDEHQTLVGMGMHLATGFMEASGGDMEAAYTALDSYGALSQEYRNEVHSHGHWGMLSLILIVLGLTFDRMALAEKQGILLACVLALSATLFPLGVLLQIGPAAGIGKFFSIAGSMGLVFGLLGAVYGLLKARPDGHTGS
ncbi:MAG: hypothetical protein IMF06_08900 [Proteobacteria bacterium]|nr:hypothetical protein [Pseudomonadota bacterium]